MLPYLALGLLLVVVLHYLLKGFAYAKPDTLKRSGRLCLYILLFLLAIWLLRLGLVHYAAIIGFVGFVLALAGRAQSLAGLWRLFRPSTPTSANPATQKMTADEARAILGVSAQATHQEIQEAYRRIIRQNHPDQGGSEYLAAQVNLARDTLLDL